MKPPTIIYSIMKTSTNQTKRTLAIGDVHGCYDALVELEKFAGFNPSDTIITLGDYIDRGPKSKEVLDWLISAYEKYNLIALLGNHELMMDDAKFIPSALPFWEMNGGIQTLSSFGSDIEGIPKVYWDFLRDCKLFHETDSHIFVHAGLDPKQPVQDQKENVLCWLRFGELKRHHSGKTIICGHTPQKSRIPGVLPYAICIDTHAFQSDGWLTCLDVHSNEYWQANSAGDTRKGSL